MITKIKKLRKLGIFSDFAWDAGLRDFQRYNLVYGWNGSGKTTLTSLLAGISTGSVPGHLDLEYEIEAEGGATVKNGNPFSTKIRVFNRDYVASNVHTISGKAKPILILGEENKKVADEIAVDEASLQAKLVRLRELEKESQEAVSRKDKLFSDIAKTIGLNTSGLATRNYRKPDAEKDFDLLSAKSLLTDESVKSNVLELQQKEMPDVAVLRTPRLSLGAEEKDISDFFSLLASSSQALCLQTVESMLLDRLKQNADLSSWVESGIDLHQKHESKKCEFCDQEVPPARLKVLAAHFSDSDRKLKTEIDKNVTMLRTAESAVVGLKTVDKANLYEDLRSTYQIAGDALESAKKAVLNQITSVISTLELKKSQATEPVSIAATLDAARLVAGLNAVNELVKSHNLKTLNFKTSKDNARKKLELHYLSTIYDEVRLLRQKVSDIKDQIEAISTGDKKIVGDVGTKELTERIGTNRAKISSSHKGCHEINEALKTFLNRNELQFEVEGEGYALKRAKSPASNLSEGERTALGFVHFVIHLKDSEFDPATGIIVVDDPVSSLDANSTFQAFAFLKNAVKDAKQVFLLTHNFDFLRLLINWVKYSKQKYSYYMIRNEFDAAGHRRASIQALDKLLQEHESEYHYLFKLLHTFQSDGTIESVYNVPNIARKVLDTFLMFRVPNGENNYAKLESLRPHFDHNKLTAIYKFTNDQSHITGKGFDPSLVQETQNNVKYLLEMIEKVFPEHYTILVSSIGA